ncbi:nadph quinone reductase [Agrilactobacillus composti DSM 18527 = JCM 14202]|uniref:Nadph quinone reductase n=1 Tax=Agrilactobacillus composti DSM 18527 = JCM 14202 TaxID=1423734 RepID=A0A0R1Y078_9LACO|nr:NADP-dependent oxidoreductase [Agrilactobacillus composti]KRM33513.1 nadph quinone reductase [Agrilactobacillus composti DSM 18527 = JCM 14202]
MLAFGYRHSGGPDVFEALDIPTPKPGANELLLDTVAVGLNNRERTERAQGSFAGTTYQISGRDAVGRVAEVGANLKNDFKVGQLVATHSEHTYAAAVLAEPANSALVPAGVDPVVAAGLITTGITAYKAVHYFAKVKTGQTVIVKGASGGVGALVAQLLHQLGVTVIGVAAAKNEALVTDLGIDNFVAYDQVNLADALKEKGDIVFNLAMNGNGGADDVAMTKTGGAIVSVAHETPELTRGISFTHIRPTSALSDQEALKALLPLLAQDKLSVNIGYTLPFSLAGIVEGHELLEERHTGRVVLKV